MILATKDPSNLSAQFLIDDIVNSDKCKTEKSSSTIQNFKYTKLVILVATMLLILLFGYFHPTSESITCDKNLVCTIEHKYWWNHSSHNTIQLSIDSDLTGKIIYRHNRHSRQKYVQPIIIDANYRQVQPFRYYYRSVEYNDHRNANTILEQEIKNFKSYLKHPENGFSLSNYAGSTYVITWIFLIILALCIYHIEKRIEKVNKFKKRNRY